jgi:pyruvate kinase
MFLRKSEILDHTNIGKLPLVEFIPILFNGDELIITSPGTLGEPATHNDKGLILQPARISCTCQSVFNEVKPGERVFFNKGRLQGIMLKVKGNEIVVKITRSGKRGTELHRGETIAFPDSSLHLPILTETALHYLDFARQHADAIEISASCTLDELKSILQLMNEKSAKKMRVVLKVDSAYSLKGIPQLMLFGMQQNLMGIEICVSKLAIGQSIDRIEEVQKQVAGWCIAAQIQLIQNNSNLLDSIKQAECNHS